MIWIFKKFVVDYKIIILIGIFLNQVAIASETSCHPVLWPHFDNLFKEMNETQYEMKNKILIKADTLLNIKPRAVRKISSAGKVFLSDPDLRASRRSFLDADRAAILALAYQVSKNNKYLISAKNSLLAWALINQPTGHPIDETRLEGFIWAYDLIQCDLNTEDKKKINLWLENLRHKKTLYHLTDLTNQNNHHTHQLKMILLLDMVLCHTDEVKMDLKKIYNHLDINIDLNSGESFDYYERDALFYHNFDLQAWLEMSLVSGCCHQHVESAFNFLIDHIRKNTIGGEFMHSMAKIDFERSRNGFQYAKKGGHFQVKRAVDTILTYYTLSTDPFPDDLIKISFHDKLSLWQEFVNYRRVFWK